MSIYMSSTQCPGCHAAKRTRLCQKILEHSDSALKGQAICSLQPVLSMKYLQTLLLLVCMYYILITITSFLYHFVYMHSCIEGADYTIGTYANQPELRFRKDDITPRSNALVISITDDDLEEPDEVIVITLLPLQDAFIYPFATCTVTIQSMSFKVNSFAPTYK